MVKVKICGITNLKDALAAQEAGCDALGFVFYRKSKRYILPLKARGIIRVLDKDILKVGVFVDAKEKTIKNIANSCALDILQFHGKETPAFCLKFAGFKVIKALRVKDKINRTDVLRYKTFGYLFDTYVKKHPGGTGRTFEWSLLKFSNKLKKQVFLSGGLDKGNVKKAIRIVRPAWVDVSSSVESKPGRKDHQRLRAFIKAAKI
ncbi:MAG: phosphoribosylanthranilate isomerase [Candidatus Omnitrophota bacterium]